MLGGLEERFDGGQLSKVNMMIEHLKDVGVGAYFVSIVSLFIVGLVFIIKVLPLLFVIIMIMVICWGVGRIARMPREQEIIDD